MRRQATTLLVSGAFAVILAFGPNSERTKVWLLMVSSVNQV